MVRSTDHKAPLFVLPCYLFPLRPEDLSQYPINDIKHFIRKGGVDPSGTVNQEI
jgi:hypothetical protein